MADPQSYTSGVANRYASALFDLARETDALDQVAASLDDFDRMLDDSADLRRLVRSPVIGSDRQVRALDAVFAKAGASGIVPNFVKLAARNRRLFALRDMIRSYRALLATHRGEATADVVSAEPLSDAHLASLKQALESATGKDVRINRSVDPSLLGGMTVKLGSRMIDTSLKTKLNSMRTAMKEVG